LRTGRDFEDVAYIALWVLFIVISMDILSGMLRKRLIQSQ
jgi:ABC-type phosphate/phosphonate transport system permease subunit